MRRKTKQPRPIPGAPYLASIGLKELHRFKTQWPCHGFPASLARVVFEFMSNGDLVDVNAYARRGKPLDTADFDGPALVALCHDAQAKVHPQHAAERVLK